MGDDGKLSGKFRDYISDSKSMYWQAGVSNETKVGNVKNNVSLAVDYFNYKSKAVNSSGKNPSNLSGDIWNGVHLTGTPIFAAPIGSVGYSKETAKAMTLADRVEIGKVSVFG
ncbi:hypothetical protein, partial [Phascolarctobacterium succinatutens]|uniref:hypothetical protein n=1 Tax=Phascolarctobacterium succinatutens TaxID=626940 RepID=UPI0026EFB393